MTSTAPHNTPFSRHAQQLRALLPEAKLVEFLTAVYDEVLVPICGARGDVHEHGFLQHHLDEQYPATEWRIGGSLGFGGKFRLRSDLTSQVDCYREDETPERLQTIASANAALKALRERFLSA